MKARFLVAVPIAAALAASTAAFASAHEFIATKTGTLKGSGGEYVIGTSAGKVACEEVLVNGYELTTKTQGLQWTYVLQKCEAFGSKVTISQSELAFNANESVGIVGSVVITDPAGKCSVLVNSGGANATLKSVKYTNVGNKITTETNVRGIHYTPSGGVCGSAEPQTNGTLAGSTTGELVGGTIKWQ
jgi:hypothetical protein